MLTRTNKTHDDERICCVFDALYFRVLGNDDTEGYQAVKKIAVNGNPAVILSAAGVLGAAPSLPCKYSSIHVHGQSIIVRG